MYIHSKVTISVLDITKKQKNYRKLKLNLLCEFFKVTAFCPFRIRNFFWPWPRMENWVSVWRVTLLWQQLPQQKAPLLRNWGTHTADIAAVFRVFLSNFAEISSSLFLSIFDKLLLTILVKNYTKITDKGKEFHK